MGVPLMMMRTATGISCRRCTSCILGFLTLWPYRAANALQAANVHALRVKADQDWNQASLELVRQQQLK